MGNIPTIPGSARIQDQQIGAKIDPRAHIAALGAAGQAASDALSVVADYEMRKQKAEDAFVQNKTAVQVMHATTQFRHNLAAMPDQSIVPTWTDTAKQTKESITSDPDFKKMSPAAQAHVMRNLNTWEAETTGEFQVAADKKAITRRVGAAQAASDAFTQTGDPELGKNAEAAWKLARDNGDLSEGAYQEKVQKIPQQIAVAQVQNGIDHNPYQTEKDLRAGAWDSKIANPNLRRQLLTEASERSNAFQSKNLNDVVTQIATAQNPEQLPPKEMLSQKLKSGDLSARGYEQAMRLVNKDTQSDARERQLLVFSRIAGLDLATEESPEKTVRQIGDEIAGLPLAMQKPARDSLMQADNRFKRNEAKDEEPVVKQTAAIGEDFFKQGLFRPNEEVEVPDETKKAWTNLWGGLGTPQKKVSQAPKPDEEWQKDASTDELTAAHINYAKWQEGMHAFFKAKPKATPEEAAAEGKRLVTPHVEEAARKALTPDPQAISDAVSSLMGP